MKKILYISQKQPFLLGCYTHLGDIFWLIFKSSSGPFLKVQILITNS